MIFFFLQYSITFNASFLLTGDYEDLDEREFQRRQSIHMELKNSWKLGLVLAILSGIFFTATSIMIQYFQVPAMEIFLVRSIFQVIILILFKVA